MGVFYDPDIGLAPGGLASVPWSSLKTTGIMPSSWGQLFLALELLIAFRAFDQGRPRYLWWLIPLFVALGQLGRLVPDGPGPARRDRRRPLARWRCPVVAGGREADETGLQGKDQPADE